ncbi:uncharacterized protein [Triticum aestivum]|uniref:uncharacterized protein n=1 Tax=Triticum aestivum TaxID=4565 RepID=UPI001ABCFF5A|nr:uncharacterized protein LOC109754624 [Aegilops tauschii subsp. strangulata]XP_044397298.1 uncharacterized protein LOC123121404 [Triticum aestivum]
MAHVGVNRPDCSSSPLLLLTLNLPTTNARMKRIGAGERSYPSSQWRCRRNWWRPPATVHPLNIVLQKFVPAPLLEICKLGVRASSPDSLFSLPISQRELNLPTTVDAHLLPVRRVPDEADWIPRRHHRVAADTCSENLNASTGYSPALAISHGKEVTGWHGPVKIKGWGQLKSRRGEFMVERMTHLPVKSVRSTLSVSVGFLLILLFCFGPRLSFGE